MPRGAVPWSVEESELAQSMKRAGFTFKEIGDRLGRTMWGVRGHLDRSALTPEERRAADRHNASLRPRSPRLDRSHNINAPNSNVINRLLDERDQRWSATPRDLTALYMGDPLPGCSALER